MDQRYDAFEMADSSCYDVMYSEWIAGKNFSLVERLLPDGWRCLFFAPHGVTQQTVAVGNLSGPHVEGGSR